MSGVGETVRQAVAESRPAEALFDALVALVSHRFSTSYARVFLLGPECDWLRAALGGSGAEIAAENGFGAAVARNRVTVVVPDTSAPSGPPAVDAGPDARFFAGVPLVGVDGTPLGSLCTWDIAPRSPSRDDIASLEQFGRHAATILELHRVAFELHEEREVLSATGYLLEMIVAGAELPGVLHSLALATEAAIIGTRCSIHLLDDTVLREGASPRLPESTRRAFDGAQIGPCHGSCGTAAFTGQTVIVSDIAADLRWTNYRHHVLPYGLRACWSVPIIGAAGLVLGTFALYYEEVRAPGPDDLDRLARWVNLAEVAITRARDITALRAAATRDALTGLMNRAEVTARIRDAAQRPDSRIAVLFVDLDQFKFINDTLGHDAGDQFLRIVARRLTAACGPGDTVARFGGDEFLVLHEDCADVAEAEALARHMLNALHRPMTIDGRSLSLSASVGLALESTDHRTVGPDGLISDADLAMYAAKRTGRNSVAVFTPALRAAAADRLSLEADLNMAMNNGELDCVFQPMVSMDTGRILDLEALLRWDSPKRGMVAPLDFISVAEDSGMIGAVGELVLRRSCAQMAAWRTIGHGWEDVVMWVNVSPRQLLDAGFAALVEEILQTAALPPENLGLEVTESTFIEDSVAVRNTVQQLRDRGIHIAIDDFGTGYSSLAQLEYLPVDVLKIDRQFVAEIVPGGARAGLVSAIVSLADTMGLRVVAEGVETPVQHELLLRLGCRWGQGYFWSPPLTADRFTTSLWQFAPETRTVGSGSPRSDCQQ
ncbi:diguanylate cyclase (GGDEF) domain-containing protein [Nakamurella panacisegetis]|uniref:Diguanylate cyclase (GGDEF) domain-containing protein n=2 Tax=Nakamurella panacisegetis TaxID=1090615 RepID=A0A1H0M5P1_9ACTN|nr:diguanylate cyclase (GGDEF) domain-containing protein [Nakamurella panacisegetis]